MKHPRTTLPIWRRYVFAVLVVALFVVIRSTIFRMLGSQFMFAAFYPAVMLSAWYGGIGPGLLSAILGAAIAPHLGAPPRTFHWLNEKELIGLTLFMFNGTMMCVVIESLHRTRHRLWKHQEELELLVEVRTAELEAANIKLKVEMEEREKASALMVASTEELRDVKAAVSDRSMVAEVDANGVMLLVNENFRALTKYDRAELEGHDYRTLYWEQPGEEPEKMWETLKARKVWKGDQRMRTKKGESVWVAVTAFSDPKAESPTGRYIVIWADITERKLAERALRESEAKYRAIGESLDYGVWICDAEGRNTYVSDSLLNLVGYTQEQFADDGWRGVVHPEEADAAVAAWRECVRTGGQWEREFQFRGVDGAWHCILGRGAQVRDDEGNLCGWAGINVDITKLKETERALRESEARYRAIGESVNYGVWICEPDGRNTYASDAFLKLVGMTQAQCSNCGWGDVLHPDEIESTVQAWKECVRSGGPWDREHRFKGVDGQLHHVLARGSQIKDADGKVLGWAGINLDINKLKRTEEALAQSEAHLRNVLDSIFAFVGVMGTDGTMLEINRAVLDVSAISPDEVVGRKFWNCMWWTYSPEVQTQIQKAVEKAAAGEVPRFDVQGEIAGGQFLWVDLTIAPMRDAEGRVTHIIPSAVDITERKRGEQLILDLNTDLENRVAQRTEELRKANEELLQQFAAIRRFEEEIVQVTKREQVRIGQDLHDDLGQQLAGIWCFMRVVEKNLARQHSPEATNAATISEMLEKSLATTRSLAHGLLPVPAEQHGLMSALTSIASRLSDIFNIHCKLECPVPVLLDDNTQATHLYRIAQESISNAVKHGRARNVTIGLSSDEHEVKLIVRNDGDPLPDGDCENDGMGLRIMRYRAGIIGGTLRIENTTDGQVSVACSLPISPAKTTPAS